MTMEDNKNYFPDHVSWRVIDAWLALPPCTLSHPYCHCDCPYFYECYPELFDDASEDDMMWVDRDGNLNV